MAKDIDIAMVNGRKVSQKHLDDMILLYKQQTKRDVINEVEKQGLIDQIIDNFLLLEEAKSRHITVAKELIDKNIEQIKKQFGKDEVFYSELEKHGIGFEKFKNNIEDTLLIQKFTQMEVQDKIKITADLLEGYYEANQAKMKTPEMVRARHILVEKNKAGSMEKAHEIAKGFLEKIAAKESFEEIAKQYSHCPSAANGGDLGMFARGKMVPEFEQVAFNLEKDEISEPVETMFGVHLIKVEEKQPEKNISFKEAQPYIEKLIFQQESQKIMKALANGLKENAEIIRY